MSQFRHTSFHSLLGVFSTVLATTSLGCAVSDGSRSEDTNGANSEVLDETAATTSPIINPVSTATAYPEAALINGDAACSASVIAPRVVLTAGHCVDGWTYWTVTTPNAKDTNGQAQQRRASGAWTLYKSTGDMVNPNTPDIGLLFFDSGEPFRLSQWPKIQMTPVANGTSAINVGRKNNGQLSYTNLYVGRTITVSEAYGFRYSYQSADLTEPGDSGGPAFLPGAAPHTIIAVTSGGGGGSSILARTDAVGSQIVQLVNQHGGFGGDGGTGTPTDPPSGGGGDAACSAQESEPNDVSTQSDRISNGVTCGKLGSGSDVDWFTWSLATSGAPYEIAVTGSETKIDMWKLVGGQYYKIANDAPNRIAKVSTGPGQYYVAITSTSGATGSYQMTLKSGNGSATSCSTPAWSGTTAYYAGQRVSRGGNVYEACYWTQNAAPNTTSKSCQDGNGLPWKLVGPC